MFLLWNPQRFLSMVDYDSWETELLEDEDIQRHITAASVVPVNIGSDGAFAMVARVGSDTEPATLTQREVHYHIVASEPYLFSSDGAARITGIEDVGIGLPDSGLSFPLAPGRWSVIVHLIAWDEEPGSRDASGAPGPDALPDFVLLLNPERGHQPRYRQEIMTFPESDQEGAT